MDLPVLGADPIRRRLLEAEARRRVEGSFEVNLYRAIGTLLMMGMPSGDAVAQQLALHRRTLNRRLKAQGRTFQSVLDAVRFDFARRLLRDTRLPVTAVAATLGYSEASSFARAFRRWSGSGPLDWRRAEQGP
jgi:AraC-like DNA-binding protein